MLAAQRKVPNVRQYVHICWELASRWEAMEPVRHRVPLPLKLMKAMVSLGYALEWRRWAGIILICFFGIARVGEVLKCHRRDLLLPRDLLEEELASTYLLLQASKTSSRGPARVQHLKIDDDYVTKLLDRTFGLDDPNQLLYSGSPAVFRGRWNFVLSRLGVPREALLTPGGLRGGGAVEGYRRGLAVTELQWRMRLRSLATLESYLQETAASSALTSLPIETLRSVRAAAALFEHLC